MEGGEEGVFFAPDELHAYLEGEKKRRKKYRIVPLTQKVFY